MAPDPRFRVQRVATLALVTAACALASYHDRALPAPLGLDAPASAFSEARAAAFASSLDAPRLAGSDAEHAAFAKLERALREVAAETRAASAGRVVVDVLRTKHSGTFPLLGPGARETREQTMAYDRLDALAARVRVRGSIPNDTRGDSSHDAGEAPSSPPRSLLFAAHVDTVHVSPGGCDNAANVAVVLETVRAFAAGLAERRDYRDDDVTDVSTPGSRGTHANASSLREPDPRFFAPLMAMFVSAEEDGFMGASGVVRDHPWFKTQVAAFANFEAMGSGGPHRAFRATIGGSSSALLRLYSLGAPRPSGTVIAADVFSSGFIKSDTDFRVFRDDGDVPGIDLAFVEKTRLYHTPRDTVEALVKYRPGSMQASGANALGFARAFAERAAVFPSAEEKNETPPRLEVRPGGVSTTRPRDVRRGADETFPEHERKPPLTVWFAFPGLGAFVLFDVDGAQMAAAVALAAVTSTALATFFPYGFGAPRAAEKEDTATLLAAVVVGVAGAALAFAAAPVVGGLAALATASVAKTPVPWSRSFGAFALCVLPPAFAASFGTLDLTRRLVRALVASGASIKAPDVSDARSTKLRACADRVSLLGAALFLALLASFLLAKGVASAYLFAVPAFGIFLGAAFAGPDDDRDSDEREVSRPFANPSFASAFAFAAPLAFAASLAFPVCLALADLAHGMAPRSRPPPGTSACLYDIVCGVVAGGAVATTAFPSLAFLVSARDPRRRETNDDAAEKRDGLKKEGAKKPKTRNPFRFDAGFVFVAVALASHVAALVFSVRAPSFTEDHPQQIAAFVAVTSGNVSDSVLVFLPAGPGSAEDAFARTLESLPGRFEPLESFASPSPIGSEDEAVSRHLESSSASAKPYHACDRPENHEALRRWDLASYSLAGSGACAARPASLARELAEAAASKDVVTELRVRVGASRAAAGGARAVPITVDFAGMTRWVIAVDSRCAKRVAFARGQDAAAEDAAAEADAARRTARAAPPVGPWRSASRGRAGTGTGTHRYAAFGVGGRDARDRPSPVTVWIETRAETESVPEKCAGDAARVRADADFETPTLSQAISAAKRDTPPRLVPFAKHHTPLKLAVLAAAGLEQDE